MSTTTSLLETEYACLESSSSLISGSDIKRYNYNYTDKKLILFFDKNSSISFNINALLEKYNFTEEDKRYIYVNLNTKTICCLSNSIIISIDELINTLLPIQNNEQSN